MKTTRSLLVGIVLFCALASTARSQSSLTLPTPRDHYKTYNVEAAQRELLGKNYQGPRTADPEEH